MLHVQSHTSVQLSDAGTLFIKTRLVKWVFVFDIQLLELLTAANLVTTSQRSDTCAYSDAVYKNIIKDANETFLFRNRALHCLINYFPINLSNNVI